MSRLFLLFFFVSFQSVLRALETASDFYTEEVNKGEKNLLDLKKKAEIYGKCWHDALLSLNMECKFLNSELQSKLAIKFTNCFLIDVGKPVCPCGPGDLIASCLSLCNDITFNTYTHFYTYTHSMCFFIKHKIFESEIAQSTLELNLLAKTLKSQLDSIMKNNTDNQNQLLHYLNKSVTDLKLLDTEITRSREQTNQLFTDFKKVTANNTNLILKLFSNINDIKIFFLREIELIYSIIFYLGLFIFLYFISSHKYVKKSRFFLILSFMIFLITEYYFNSICIKINLDLESRVYFIWKIRQLNFAICIAILIKYYYSYIDYPVANHRMIVEMASDMQEMKMLLKRIAGTSSQTHGNSAVSVISDAATRQLTPNAAPPDLHKELNHGVMSEAHSAVDIGDTGVLRSEPCTSSSLAYEEMHTNDNTSWLKKLQSKIRNMDGFFRDGHLRVGGAPESEVSIRPDGSIRPAVKVKSGYVPPDFVANNRLVNRVSPVDINKQERNLEKKRAEIEQLKILRSNGFVLSPDQEDKIQNIELWQN